MANLQWFAVRYVDRALSLCKNTTTEGYATGWLAVFLGSLCPTFQWGGVELRHGGKSVAHMQAEQYLLPRFNASDI
jgi:hypothetical protein